MKNIKVLNIIDLVMDINNETDADLFVSISPHVDKITIDVHLNGWVSNASPDYSISAYTEEQQDLACNERYVIFKTYKMETVIDKLIDLYNDLKNPKQEVFEEDDLVYISNKDYEFYGLAGTVLEVQGSFVRLQIHTGTESVERVVYCKDIKKGINPEILDDMKNTISKI